MKTETNTLTSPSKLYCQAAGIRPSGTATADRSSTCAMCADTILVGDLCTPAKGQFTDAFNNKLDLVEGARTVCGHCGPLWTKDWLQKYSKTYACADGVFKLASNEDMASFLFNPPPAPFVAILSTTQQQHLIWRTPVNYNQERIVIRMGDELLVIRRKLLLEEALPAWTSLCTLMKEQGLKGMPATLDRELARFSMGVVRKDVAERAEALGLVAAVATLNKLSQGEWWALNVARQFDAEAISKLQSVQLVSPAGVRLVRDVAETEAS